MTGEREWQFDSVIYVWDSIEIKNRNNKKGLRELCGLCDNTRTAKGTVMPRPGPHTPRSPYEKGSRKRQGVVGLSARTQVTDLQGIFPFFFYLDARPTQVPTGGTISKAFNSTNKTCRIITSNENVSKSTVGFVLCQPEINRMGKRRDLKGGKNTIWIIEYDGRMRRRRRIV